MASLSAVSSVSSSPTSSRLQAFVVIHYRYAFDIKSNQTVPSFSSVEPLNPVLTPELSSFLLANMSNLRPNFYVKEMGQSSPSAKGCGDSKDTPPVEIPEPLKIRKAKASLSLDALRFHSDPSEESTDISHSTCGGSTKTPTKKSSFTLTRYLKRRLSWSQDSKSTTDLDNDVCILIHTDCQMRSTNLLSQDQKPNLSDARKTIGNATPHRRGALSRMKGSFDDLVRPSGVRSPPSSHGGSMRTSAQQSPSRLSQRLRQRLSWSQDSDSTTDLDEVCLLIFIFEFI